LLDLVLLLFGHKKTGPTFARMKLTFDLKASIGHTLFELLGTKGIYCRKEPKEIPNRANAPKDTSSNTIHVANAGGAGHEITSRLEKTVDL
jgi:hypothetical protein